MKKSLHALLISGVLFFISSHLLTTTCNAKNLSTNTNNNNLRLLNSNKISFQWNGLIPFGRRGLNLYVWYPGKIEKPPCKQHLWELWDAAFHASGDGSVNWSTKSLPGFSIGAVWYKKCLLNPYNIVGDLTLDIEKPPHCKNICDIKVYRNDTWDGKKSNCWAKVNGHWLEKPFVPAHQLVWKGDGTDTIQFYYSKDPVAPPHMRRKYKTDKSIEYKSNLGC